jgi:lipopolysaccharide biosynthesis protein
MVQAERAALEKAVDEEIAAEAAADEETKQQKREQIAAEERRLAEIEEQRQAEVGVQHSSAIQASPFVTLLTMAVERAVEVAERAAEAACMVWWCAMCSQCICST